MVNECGLGVCVQGLMQDFHGELINGCGVHNWYELRIVLMIEASATCLFMSTYFQYLNI